MKLLAVAALLTAVTAAASAGPGTATRPRQAGDVPAAGRNAGWFRSPADRGGCTSTGARIRTGEHQTLERNELTPSEAALAERNLSRMLSKLGVGQQHTGSPGGAAAGQRSREPGRVTIPVYFHVLHNGPKGNISDAAIKSQIDVMNSAYGGRYGGADTGFTFVLRQVTRTDNATWYSDPERYETTYKPKLHAGVAGALNLYSADLGPDLLGWSTFPWRYGSEPALDGVTIHIGSMPNGPIEHFNRGFSATHEVGHWLGLYHTFQNGCDGQGDRVSDTPQERDPTNGCPTGKDTCPAPGKDPVHNFMDYAWDTCMNQFTAGQGTRMHQVWTAYRASRNR